MKKQEHKSKKQGNIWQLQEAKAKFSEVIENATEKGLQTITKKGEPVAVILSKKEYDKMTAPKTSLVAFFKKAPCPGVELDFKRSKDFPRKVDL